MQSSIRKIAWLCVIAASLTAASFSTICQAQEATTPPATTTVPAPAEVPERTQVRMPEPATPPSNTDLPTTSVKVGGPAAVQTDAVDASKTHAPVREDYSSLVFVFMLSTFIGLGVIMRVSRLLHTPLMSLTNAISAIAVVGAIIIAGGDHPPFIQFLGAIALFASMTNIVSGFLITDRMLKMFKTPGGKS
jgi:H+-translocating NAD(P) transhydrogenase subunit alpha